MTLPAATGTGVEPDAWVRGAMLTPPQDVMLAKPVDRLPHPTALPGGCAYEPKWDGYRALLFCTEEGCLVQSRRGHDISGSFPDIVAPATKQLPVGTVLDGELVVWGENALDFPSLQRRVVAPTRARSLAKEQPASFVAFDLLASEGEDLRGRPFAHRRTELERVLTDVGPPVQLTPHTADVEQARIWLEEYAAADVGLEGMVAKGLSDVYQPGRRGWLKYRFRDTAEAVVGAVTGHLQAPERLVLGLFDAEGELAIAGSTGVLRPSQRAAVGPLLRPPIAPHPWPEELPSGRMGSFGGGKVAVTLVEPSLIVEVSADTAFEHGKWRHLTRFVRTRPDLTPEDVAPPTRAVSPAGEGAPR